MADTIRIDGVEVEFESGDTKQELIDLELDKFAFKSPFTLKKEPYEPFTLCEIVEDEIVTQYFLNSDDVSQVGASIYYRHDILFIELTKYLERITIEDNTNTKSITGISRTQLDVINRILDMQDEINISLSTRLLTLIQDTEAPNYTFQGKNLREILNIILAEHNAIPRIISIIGTTWNLDYDLYNKRSNLITNVAVPDFPVTYNAKRSIEDYYTDYRSDVKNGVVEKDVRAGGFYYPSKSGHVTVRAKDVNFDNTTSVIKFPKGNPLLSFTTILKQVGFFDALLDEFIFLDMDITPYIVEKGTWDGLEKGDLNFQDNPGERWKANTLYYVLQGDELFNIGGQYGTPIKETAINLVVDSWLFDNGYDKEDAIHIDPELYFFNFFLVTSLDTEVKVTRADVKKFNKRSSGYFNQPSPTADLISYPGNIFSTLNRIGNAPEQLSYTFNTGDPLLKIGDFTEDDKVIYALETITFNKFVVQKPIFYQSFNKANQRTEVSNFNRKYAIEERVERVRLFQEYIEFSSTNKTNTGFRLDSNGFKTIINVLKYQTTYDTPFNTAHYAAANVTPSGKSLYNAIYSFGFRNALAFVCRFANPINGLPQLELSSGNKSNENVPYANPDGTLQSYDLKVTYDLTNTLDDDEFPLITSATNSGEVLYNINDGVVDKDSGESLNITLQVPIISDIDNNRENEFIIGEFFMTDNNAIKLLSVTRDLKLYTSDTKYNLYENTKVKDTNTAQITYTLDFTNGILTLDSTPANYWAIGDDEGDLYLACNVQGLEIVYINCLKEDPRFTDI